MVSIKKVEDSQVTKLFVKHGGRGCLCQKLIIEEGELLERKRVLSKIFNTLVFEFFIGYQGEEVIQ